MPDVPPLTLPPGVRHRPGPHAVSRSLVVTVTADRPADLTLVADGVADLLTLLPHNAHTPDHVAIAVRSLTDNERTADQLAEWLEQANAATAAQADRAADALDQLDQLAAELERARAHLAGVEAAAVGLGLAPELAALLVGLDADRLALLAIAGPAGLDATDAEAGT